MLGVASAGHQCQDRDHGLGHRRAHGGEQGTRHALRDAEALAEVLKCIGKDLRGNQDRDEGNDSEGGGFTE